MNDLLRHIELIWFKALAELRLEVTRSYIGILWWVLEPVLYMAAFWLVFGLGQGQGGPGFVAFLLCGLVPWKWFSATVSTAASSISAHAGLLHQVDVRKFVLPGFVVAANSLKFGVILALLMVFLLLVGVSPTLAWLWLPAVILTQLLFTLALALCAAAAVPLVPDLRLVIDNLMLMLLFVSGIFFDPATLAPGAESIVRLNPLVGLFEAYRAVLLDGRVPSFAMLSPALVGGSGMLLLAVLLLRRFERHYPKYLL